MPATVNIYSYHGASGSQTGAAIDGTTIKYKAADNDTNDNNNPVNIPASGTAFSYQKFFAFYATTTPATQINNLKVYTSGANPLGTGVDIQCAAVAGYATPAAAAVTSSSSIFGYTSGAPLALTGSIANPSTGVFGQYLESVLTVLSTATQGPTANATITFSYDES